MRSVSEKVRAAILTIGLAAGISWFASPARAQTVTACVNDKNGAVTFISKGNCKPKTHSVVLNPPPATTLTVQKINVVDTGNKTVATLGKDSNGNLLTFFDSGGNKAVNFGINAGESFAGLVTWDNNKVIPGTGVIRTVFGESNPNLGPVSGFGASVLDGSGNARTVFGTSYDLTSNDVFVADSDGSGTGVGSFQSTQFKGFFTSDSNGINRQFSGLVFDPTINDFINEIALSDDSGVVRVSAAQVPPDFVNPADHRGNAFVLWDQNGLQQAAMAALDDGSLAGFDTFDPNNMLRFGAFLTPTDGMKVNTYDSNGNVTGHLP